MQNNFYFMEHLVKERVEGRLKESELHRAAKVDATSMPFRRSLLNRARCIILTAAAALLGWGASRRAIRGCSEPAVN
jgi:hypothetical protein